MYMCPNDRAGTNPGALFYAPGISGGDEGIEPGEGSGFREQGGASSKISSAATLANPDSFRYFEMYSNQSDDRPGRDPDNGKSNQRDLCEIVTHRLSWVIHGNMRFRLATGALCMKADETAKPDWVANPQSAGDIAFPPRICARNCCEMSSAILNRQDSFCESLMRRSARSSLRQLHHFYFRRAA